MKVFIVLIYNDYEGYSDPQFVTTKRGLAEKYIEDMYKVDADSRGVSVEEYKEKYTKRSYYEIFEEDVVKE